MELVFPELKLPEKYKTKKKKILLMSDDIRTTSGVANISREIVVGTSHIFDWVQLGSGLKHPDNGKVFDLSADINKKANIVNANVKIYANDGYGDSVVLSRLLEIEKPDAILHFTDPRFWLWFYNMEREIRTKIPIMYYTIWDNLPFPHWNEPYYDSCDALMCISKQTYNLVKHTCYKHPKQDWAISYVPHGVDHKIFFPIDQHNPFWEEFKKFEQDFKKQNDVDFIFFWNNRNAGRKQPGDVVLAFKTFCDKLPKNKAKRVALLMHTEITSAPGGEGTDLGEVVRNLCPDYKVIFSPARESLKVMNFIYNLVDVTINIASNEGFGISSLESILCGKVIINNVTGGLQDQCRFENDLGDWIDFDEKFTSNHTGVYKKCGPWVKPVFPSNRSLKGSNATPYIFDDRCSFEEVADAMLYWYNMPKLERLSKGLQGRDWATSIESGMTAENMCKNMVKSINSCLENFTPRNRFDLIRCSDKVYRNPKSGIYI